MEVRKMQQKLATWSQDQSFEFDDIFNLVCRPEFLHEAWKSVASNSGAATAGVDGVTAKEYAEEPWILEENLSDLRSRLKSGKYSPEPVRRTYIPKSDTEVRPLGIPTIDDRVVQESLRLVLEPIYETDFSDDSFGFRPNRGCHDAIQLVRNQLNPGMPNYKKWVLDLDIKGYFDNVSHTELMWILQNRITDNKVLDLIYDTLKAGVKENGQVQVTGKGTPQGGIISPLLANVYLNELDQWIQQWTNGREGGQEYWAYVRYADDFMILTDGHKGKAEAMMERVKEFIDDELRLKLSQKKSSLTHAESGISFVGYDMVADSTSGGCKMYIPQEAKENIRSLIREGTEEDVETSIVRKLRRLRMVTQGWANYYKYCTDAGRVFNNVFRLLWHQTTHWLAERFECSRRKLLRNKLDSYNPIIYSWDDGKVILPDISGTSTKLTLNPRRHDHPYLNEEREEPTESQWGDSYRDGHPGANPDLGNKEDRKGSADQAVKARSRDENTCQAVGCDAGGGEDNSLPVHHIRRYNSPDDDRMDNMVTLCRACHHVLTHTAQGVKVRVNGREIELT